MAFTSNAFVKRSTGSSGSDSKPKDMHVIVTGFDLEKHTMSVKRANDGKEFTVRIEAAAYERGKASAAGNPGRKWSGQLIDKLMEANLPIGKHVVLENARFIKFGKGQLECTCIINVPDDDKVIEGLIGLHGYEGRIQSVLLWDQKAHELTEQNINAVAAQFDEVIAIEQEGKYPPCKYGVQFRIVENGVVVEQTPTFDWKKIEAAAEGEPKGHSYTGDEIKELCQQFLEYANGRHAEMCTYKSYKASVQSKDMAYTDRNKRIKMFIECESKLTASDPETIVGRTYVVQGIVALTGDSVKVVNKQAVVSERNIAQKVFTNGAAGNVHSWIRSPDGSKVTFANELKIFKQGEISEKLHDAYEKLQAVGGKMESPLVGGPVVFSDDDEGLFEDDPFNS